MTRFCNAPGASRGAIVLQHGLGSNGLVFNFPGRSLVQVLAACGFDCFISELRGARGHVARAYGLDDYLDQDLPAIIENVQRVSGHARIHWVGHSLGGILMMMYAIDHPDAPIDRFIAVGSALDYRFGRSIYAQLRLLKGLVSPWLHWVPFDRLAQLNAPIAGHGPKMLPEQMNFWRENVEARVLRRMLARGFSAIPMRLLLDLDSTFAPSGLSRHDGQINYLVRAHEFRLRSCLLVGTRDEQCGELTVDATARLLSNAPKLRVARFGRTHGHAQEYGHFDLLVGKHAEREVWPTIRDFVSGVNEPVLQVRERDGALP
ncbi:MAG TPA: alpha/beta hydrolase [Polyangiales bacterium]|nr:alpha/beta hydrolase [Polyangiales bacterium]